MSEQDYRARVDAMLSQALEHQPGTDRVEPAPPRKCTSCGAELHASQPAQDRLCFLCQTPEDTNPNRR